MAKRGVFDAQRAQLVSALKASLPADCLTQSPEEAELLRNYRKLDAAGKRAVLEAGDNMLANGGSAPQ